MQSEHILISDLKEHYDRVDDILDDYLFRLDITGKNANRFSLLTEEALRLIKSIVSSETAIELWFEGNKRISHICLMLEAQVDANKTEELVSISSSGENGADRTFLDELKDFFVKPKAASWSLAEYEAELMQKREKDKYALEAWENLERSVLANLANDIAVGVKNNHILMIITKDFSEALSTVGSKRPSVETKQIYIAADDKIINEALSKVDDCVAELDLRRKDALHMKLIFGETIGMIREMTGDFSALVWAQKYKKQCALKFVGITKMDADKKYDILSMSTSGKNALVHGLMGKIKDIVETGLLNYEGVMKLQQEYNGAAINYGGAGLYSDLSLSITPGAFTGFMWSMNDYKNALDSEKLNNAGAKEAWDELEKSIVASLAKDVIVGVNKNRVEITIVYDNVNSEQA